MTETRTISVPVYRDTEGRPVCATMPGMCQLLKHGRFGSISFCGISGDELYRFGGYLRPSDNCPLWRDDVK